MSRLANGVDWEVTLDGESIPAGGNDEEPRVVPDPRPELPEPTVKLASPMVGSSLKAALVEVAAGLVEEGAAVIAAAARGQLDLEATVAKLSGVADELRLYLDALKALVKGQ